MKRTRPFAILVRGISKELLVKLERARIKRGLSTRTAAILERCELDVACTGASYWVSGGGMLRNLPAEFVTIVSGSDRHPEDPALAWDARPVGIIYGPPDMEPEVWPWAEVGAYVPESDPSARWRGMSWLRPAMEDVAADNGARRFLTRFFEASATPNSVATRLSARRSTPRETPTRSLPCTCRH